MFYSGLWLKTISWQIKEIISRLINNPNLQPLPTKPQKCGTTSLSFMSILCTTAVSLSRNRHHVQVLFDHVLCQVIHICNKSSLFVLDCGFQSIFSLRSYSIQQHQQNAKTMRKTEWLKAVIQKRFHMDVDFELTVKPNLDLKDLFQQFKIVGEHYINHLPQQHFWFSG